jgi:hypothetical protein
MRLRYLVAPERFVAVHAGEQAVPAHVWHAVRRVMGPLHLERAYRWPYLQVLGMERYRACVGKLARVQPLAAVDSE